MSNSLHLEEQHIDVGDCSIHSRPYECFSLDSFKLICPSCLMFGPHKGENVCSIEEAGRFLRGKLDDGAKKGLFKVDKTETILLDIRQTKLTCEESKAKVIKEVEAAFNDLIKKLKERKTEVMKDIEEHFTEQLERISKNEEVWVEKQEISVDLANLSKSGNDVRIVQRAKFIMDGLEALIEPLNYHTANILSSVDLHFKAIPAKNKDLDPKELVRAFDNYGQKSEVMSISYRC